jgi:hypothetical protein
MQNKQTALLLTYLINEAVAHPTNTLFDTLENWSVDNNYRDDSNEPAGIFVCSESQKAYTSILLCHRPTY